MGISSSSLRTLQRDGGGKEIKINRLPPIVYENRLVSSHHDIMFEHICAVREPDMGMQCVVDHDVVAYPAIEPFSQLESPGQQESVLNEIVARSVVEIDVPTMLARHAVMGNDNGSDGVQRIK